MVLQEFKGCGHNPHLILALVWKYRLSWHRVSTAGFTHHTRVYTEFNYELCRTSEDRAHYPGNW